MGSGSRVGNELTASYDVDMVPCTGRTEVGQTIAHAADDCQKRNIRAGRCHEEEVVQIENDTVYGLAGAVFTTDGAHVIRVIRELRAGITWINCYIRHLLKLRGADLK